MRRPELVSFQSACFRWVRRNSADTTTPSTPTLRGGRLNGLVFALSDVCYALWDPSHHALQRLGQTDLAAQTRSEIRGANVTYGEGLRGLASV